MAPVRWPWKRVPNIGINTGNACTFSAAPAGWIDLAALAAFLLDARFSTRAPMTAADTELVSETRFYTWSFPGSPVRVRIDLALVGRMQRQLQESPAAGLGLMFGRALGPGTTEITGFQPVPDLKIGAAIAQR